VQQEMEYKMSNAVAQIVHGDHWVHPKEARMMKQNSVNEQTQAPGKL